MEASFKKILALFFIMTLVACGDSEKSTKNIQTDSTDNLSTFEGPTEDVDIARSIEITTKRKVEFNEDFSNIESFKEHINTYEVIFRPLSGSYADAKVECKKVRYDQRNDPIKGSFNQFGDEALLEVTITEEDTHEVNFFCETTLNGETLDTYSGKLRKSFVINNTKSFVKHIGNISSIETLLIEESGTLVTNDHNVELEVVQLISMGGQIKTFPQELAATTQDNSNGNSGGKIKIKALKAHGELHVELRGLDGGKQTNKRNKREKKPRDPKLDGTCPARVREGHFDPKDCEGKRGHKGHTGHKGFKGKNGGNSGSLEITTGNNLLNLTVHYFPGNGGLGGEGGEGGDGSKGGYGNHVEIIPMDSRPGVGCVRCSLKSIAYKHKFDEGLDGFPGDQGAHGDSGESGIKEESTIKMGEEFLRINHNWTNN